MRGLLLAVLLSSSLVACGNSGGAGGDDSPMPDAPMFAGEKFTLSYGPVTVQPGEEGTQCVWLRLGNTSAIKVNSMHNQLTAGSHHLIVYKDDQHTTEQTTRIDCQPFTGTLNGTGMIAPLAITQRKDDSIFLPNGVAYTFDPNQMIKIEVHYKNSGDAPLDVKATVDIYAADPATIQHEAAILFAGSPDIDVAAGQTATLHQFFTPPASVDFSKAKFFAITGHTHQYGTAVKVRVGMEGGALNEVYAPSPFLWDEPATATPPEFMMPAGGGFDFECTWNNTSNMPVQFGESADQEMCFFWAYYYPSIGSKVCFHTEEFGGQNECCPGGAFCDYIENMF
jgi:hypothetical protein